MYPLITLQFPRQSVTESPGWSLRPFVLRLGFSCSSSWAKHCCTFTGLLTNSSSPGRGRHPKLWANLGVPLEGREAGIRLRHRMVVESQQMEENGRSPVVFHRRGSKSRLWNIFSFWVLSVMDYRQPISQAALLPPEIFFFFTFSFSLFFWGGCSSASACLVTSRGFITRSAPPRRLVALAVTALARGSRTKGLSDESLEFSLRKHPSKAINNWGGVLKFSWRRQDIFFIA